MFGRKRDDGANEQELLKAANEELRERLREWAEHDLKKPYQSAGFDLEAAIRYVDSLESLASGSSGHPWPVDLKFEMVRNINGADGLPDLKKRVEKLQMEYETLLRERG